MNFKGLSFLMACSAFVTAAFACESDASCDASQYCYSGYCFSRVAEGGSCDGGKQCEEDLSCQSEKGGNSYCRSVGSMVLIIVGIVAAIVGCICCCVLICYCQSLAEQQGQGADTMGLPAQPQSQPDIETSAIGAASSVPRGPADKEMPDFRFEVTIEKVAGKVVGLGIDELGPKGIRIRAVRKDGLVEEWNTGNPDQMVHENDFIVAVNGVAGHSDQMMAELKASSALRLVLSRQSSVAAV